MISIVVPVFNESRRIGRALETVTDFVERYPELMQEVIFVDDGSSDDTASQIHVYNELHPDSRIVLISYKENKGKGFAVKTGMSASKAPHTVFTDVDFSASLDEILSLYTHIETSDIVIASRYVSGSNVPVPFPLIRRFMSKTYNFLRKMLLKQTINDSQCGLKMFNKRAIEEIFPLMTISGLAFDTEVLAIAQAKKLSIAEIGVTWSHNNNGNLKPFRSSQKMFKDLLKIRTNLSSGVYQNSIK
ncbi:MAG TPA: dolichyl-phosphate beta-glucosyltransferase [Candidatus Paceibacterota bacterium]|jgi:dolichyl-phosphate beta-glucosyltransferase|nr:dolichyl-phosphate beta-glucosyltransferase [Candidatus Paceibacterota bacterium]